MMKLKLLAICLAASGAWSTHAAAQKVTRVNFSAHVSTRNIGFLDEDEAVVISGYLKPSTKTSQVMHVVKFRPRRTVLNLDASWRSAAMGSLVRFVGVNIDLLDSNGMLIESDSFTGILGGFAHSTLTFAALDPAQTYRLVLTGTRQSTATYTLVIDSAAP